MTTRTTRASYYRDYRARNSAQIAKVRRARKEKAARERISSLGGRCSCCEESEVAFLLVSKNKVLCHNCAYAIARYGYCPHSRPEGTESVKVIDARPMV